MVPSFNNYQVDQQCIEDAYLRISSFIHATPVLTSSNLNSLTGKKLFFKCENFQKTGSFKARGALNHIKCLLNDDQTFSGVITHSSGNHGQALAWAASQCNLECVVVVPSNAPSSKVNAIHHYGAKTVICEPTMMSRVNTCKQKAEELNYAIVDPHDDVKVMCGQGTVGLELLDQLPELDAILVSVGGGGLVAGLAKYVKSKSLGVRVFCCEPEEKYLHEQLQAVQTATEHTGALLNTIADGIRVKEIGNKCFPLLVECCEKTVFTLTDQEIKEATKLIWQRLKVVVETSAALPLAAVLKYKEELADYSKIGLILCGAADEREMIGAYISSISEIGV